MKRQKNITRRQFIRQSAVFSSAAMVSCRVAEQALAPDRQDAAGQQVTSGEDGGRTERDGVSRRTAVPAMATRTLGRTGMDVSVLSFGGGSQFTANGDGEWEPLLERAVELGINYFDNASEYGTEYRYGEVLSAYRDRIYLASKFNGRTSPSAGPRSADEMKKELETSLTMMKTDYLDVYLMHSLESHDTAKAAHDELSHIEKEIWPAMQKFKEEGMVRFIGFSSMNAVQNSMNFIKTLHPDVALMAMNATKYGNFARYALPEARTRNTGVLAMKVMRDLVGQNGVTPDDLLGYALSQEGVSSVLVGHVGMEVLEQNARIAGAYTTSLGVNRAAVEQKVRHLAGPHALCWARPGYLDDGVVV